MKRLLFVSALAAVASVSLGSQARAQFLLVPDWTSDRVLLLDSNDGSVINANFIVDDPSSINYDFDSPKDAIQVGQEVWVVDQLSDAIYRFDINGAFIAGITTGLDNARGMALVGSTVYVANNSSGNGAPGQAIVMFSMAGTNLGSFPVSDPFDVIGFQGDLLIADIAGDNIQRYTTAGVFVSTFHDSDGITGIDFPEQLANASNGNVLAAGFISPVGLFEYDTSGVQVNYYAVGTGNRGVAQLGNGNLLFTDAGGIKVRDGGGVVTTILAGGNFQFINPFNGGTPPPIAYCSGKINSAGCTPAIGSTGSMSATATAGFVLSATNELNNKVGLVLYSEFGRDSSPFGAGGILCVKAPTRRSKGFNSGGTPPPAIDCTGVFSIDFNTFGRGLLGTPPNPATYLSLPGQVVTAQFWGRDPGIPSPNNFSLSNGLEFTVGP